MENLRRNGTSTEERPVLTESLIRPPRVNSTRWKNTILSLIATIGVATSLVGMATLSNEQFLLAASVGVGSLVMLYIGTRYNYNHP